MKAEWKLLKQAGEKCGSWKSKVITEAMLKNNRSKTLKPKAEAFIWNLEEPEE